MSRDCRSETKLFIKGGTIRRNEWEYTLVEGVTLSQENVHGRSISRVLPAALNCFRVERPFFCQVSVSWYDTCPRIYLRTRLSLPYLFIAAFILPVPSRTLPNVRHGLKLLPDHSHHTVPPIALPSPRLCLQAVLYRKQ